MGRRTKILWIASLSLNLLFGGFIIGRAIKPIFSHTLAPHSTQNNDPSHRTQKYVMREFRALREEAFENRKTLKVEFEKVRTVIRDEASTHAEILESLQNLTQAEAELRKSEQVKISKFLANLPPDQREFIVERMALRFEAHNRRPRGARNR